MRTVYGSRGVVLGARKTALRAKSQASHTVAELWIPALLLLACSTSASVSAPREQTPVGAAAPTAPSLTVVGEQVPPIEERGEPDPEPTTKQQVGDERRDGGPEKDYEGPPVQARVEQLLASPVTHLTAGKRRGAALTKRPDGTTLHVFALDPELGAGHPGVPLARAAPTPLTAGTRTLGLYMGRDDWPRVISAGDSSVAQHYFRFRPNPGWESPRDEQGGLVKAGTTGGFYGVLGHADPEVLCSPAAFCYEKRQSGWQKRPLPGASIWSVRLLSNGEAWAWLNSNPGALCRLTASWDCTLPHPGVPIVSLAYVNGTYLALTKLGLMTYETEWNLRARVTDGQALLSIGGSAVVLSWHGAWLWDGQLHRILINGTHTSGGCCLEPLSNTPDTFVVGGEHGVTRVTLE